MVFFTVENPSVIQLAFTKSQPLPPHIHCCWKAVTFATFTPCQQEFFSRLSELLRTTEKKIPARCTAAAIVAAITAAFAVLLDLIAQPALKTQI